MLVEKVKLTGSLTCEVDKWWERKRAKGTLDNTNPTRPAEGMFWEARKKC